MSALLMLTEYEQNGNKSAVAGSISPFELAAPDNMNSIALHGVFFLLLLMGGRLSPTAAAATVCRLCGTDGGLLATTNHHHHPHS